MEKHLPEIQCWQNHVRALHIQQRERHHIFQELNGSVVQTLSSLRMHLSLLDKHVGTNAQAKLSLGQSQDLAQQALSEIHNMMDSCQPIVPDDLGLSEVLQSLVWLSKGIGIQIEFYIDNPFPSLLFPLETTLYKLVHETLSLAFQHALHSPTTICLTVVEETVQLVLLLSDGLLAALFSQKIGQPILFRMQGQVEEIGGTCTLRGDTGRVSEMIVELPLLLREREAGIL